MPICRFPLSVLLSTTLSSEQNSLSSAYSIQLLSMSNTPMSSTLRNRHKKMSGIAMASEETDYPIDLLLYFKTILSSFVCKFNIIFFKKLEYLIQNFDVLTYLTNPIYRHNSPMFPVTKKIKYKSRRHSGNSFLCFFIRIF